MLKIIHSFIDPTFANQNFLLESFISTSSLSQHEFDERQICQNCFIKFNELDEHQVMVDRIQQELVDLYNTSITIMVAEPEQEIEVKLENETCEEPLDYEAIDEILEVKISPRKSKKPKTFEEPSSRKKKKPRTNQNDPTGFSVSVIDGKNHYKCEICSKVVTRRPQLHRMTHTSERTFECEICGQFFKSLKCLYGHKKTHGERTYWGW